MVNIKDADAFDRMASVEGERWKQYQLERPNSAYGFEAFRLEQAVTEKFIAELPESDREAALEDNLLGIMVDGNSAIYGEGGWNRYFVKNSGEIVFSKHHSTPDGVAKARAAGFTISGGR